MTYLALSVADAIKGEFRIGATYYLVVHKAYITIHGRDNKVLFQCKHQQHDMSV